ncbi:MAG: RT0821/Lpp0805 family surface protein [Hyphomicrobium sp.]
MRNETSLFPALAAGFTAFALVATIFVSSDFALANDAVSEQAAAPDRGCACPNSGSRSSTKPKFAGHTPPLDESDEIATLESLQFALTQVADGSSYVWHRSHGRLSGVVKPTSSFKDAEGSVCRRILVVLNSNDTTRKTETIACRLETGLWQLKG